MGRLKVEPKWRYNDRWLENKLGPHRAQADAGEKIYPMNLNGHNVKLQLFFERGGFEPDRLDEIRFTCVSCSGKVKYRSENLFREEDDDVSKLRGWMHGFFVEHDCV